MYSSLAACRAFTYTTARAAERDDLTNHDCAALLLYLGEAATKVALDGIQILGGNGYSKFFRRLYCAWRTRTNTNLIYLFSQ